jgi:three-Cys-motif partner protein
MVEKPYKWSEGAKLEEHSRRKHKILREYFYEYLKVRCQNPKQQRFRLAIMDGFAGGGRYSCGEAGSPVIFVEELKKAVGSLNIERAKQGIGLIEFECLLVLNDLSRDAIELLKSNVAPVLKEIQENEPRLHIFVDYMNEAFDVAYPKMKLLLNSGGYRNVLFNLDQCGHSHVKTATLLDIMRAYPSVEIFYTFAIQSLLTYLQQSNPVLLDKQLSHLGITSADLGEAGTITSKNSWLGAAERMVFETFKMCASYVSPFSINNPDGWRYWFIHFANNYRARQVYNNTLHKNSSSQAHFGRPALNMLNYDPQEEGALYLFDQSGRDAARLQLAEDVPRLVSEFGDVVGIGNFYEHIYNATPAHADDIHQAMIDNPDIEVITPHGGERRKANKIGAGDIIKLKRQISFFSMLLTWK